MKKVLIIGCNGQDGTLLQESLSRQGHQVTGIARSSYRPSAGDWRLPLDISDTDAVHDLIRTSLPDEIYYVAAYHHSSENMPVHDTRDLFDRSFQVHVHSLINFLEGMRRYSTRSRLFYAASSHVFGNATMEPQDETTAFNPKCVYGITKTAGVHACRFYRNQHDLFISCGILYNHESTYRKPVFVSQKIIRGAINIKTKRQNRLLLGNLSAVVDWGYAPDYVEAFQKILGATEPADFIVATGKKHSVLEFVEAAFGYLDLDWEKYIDEDKSIIVKSGAALVGNPGKLMSVTGWRPSVDFAEMIRLLLTEAGERFKQ